MLTIRRPGRRPVVANLGAYENRVNPDRRNTYGILAGGSPCAEDAAKRAFHVDDATYHGVLDAHPYQVVALPRGAWAVADAAANAILQVNKRGRISTRAVLPPQVHKITASEAGALHEPCLAGVTYGFEPVPTDVERDRRGNLWVSTLPGGAEGPELGARGSVYRVGKHGGVQRRATGFLGATNLALAGGKVYVAELFNNRVATIRRGRVVTAVSIERPVSVEATRHKLYVGQLADIFGPGTPSPGGIYRFPR